MKKICTSILLSLLIIGLSFSSSIYAEGADSSNNSPVSPQYSIVEIVVDRTFTFEESYIHITGTYDVINGTTVQNINLTYTASEGVSASFVAGYGSVTAGINWLDCSQLVTL